MSAPLHPPVPVAWRLRTGCLTLPSAAGRHRPLVMGIVNVTPDSFSDGGRHLDPGAAVAHGLRLVAEGADILDVGGESTRPFSDPVDADEEWRRVGTVVRRLADEAGVPVSIDTSKARVAGLALDAGVEIVNDVTGLEGDPEMLGVVVHAGAGVCAMHMRGTPRTMQVDPRYDDVVAEIQAYLALRRDTLVAAGVARDRICLDPGIGFGKSHAHNLDLMRHAGRFLELGAPILVGHSRKGFLGRAIERRLGRPATDAERDALTASTAAGLAAAGIHVLRVHAVGLVRAALDVSPASR